MLSDAMNDIGTHKKSQLIDYLTFNHETNQALINF